MLPTYCVLSAGFGPPAAKRLAGGQPLHDRRVPSSRVTMGKGRSRSRCLILSAPTGPGKTVMATALMERMLLGDSEHEPDPEATFLWLTDQPELNEQTRRKLLTGSSAFDEDNLVTVEAASFDQRVFDPGKVFFLNTQKLGRNSSLTGYGDTRRYLIWETIAMRSTRSSPSSLSPIRLTAFPAPMSGAGTNWSRSSAATS